MPAESYKPSGPTQLVESDNLRIEVVTTAFKGVYPYPLGQVCASAAAQIYRHLPRPGFTKTILLDRSEAGVPISAYAEGPSGQSVVLLAPTADGTYWSQYAYQFAHEATHFLARQPGHVNGLEGWLEEAICECGSIFALRGMAKAWAISPPGDYKPWIPYAASLQHYADEAFAKPERQLGKRPLSDWLKEYLPQLRDSRFRVPSQLVANQLLPLFEATPSSWDAVRYLNHGRDLRDAPLPHFLSEWMRSVPKTHRKFVHDIGDKLGVRV